MLDLERVEILRGPQGTLFGKNSIGGAVRLISKKPQDVFEASVEGTYGSYDRIDLRGMVNIPLIDDQLALRVSGAGRRSGADRLRPWQRLHGRNAGRRERARRSRCAALDAVS